MSKDPLHVYLAKERANGAYSFSLRVQPMRYIGDSEVRFVIHPECQSGETNDYAVSEDPERGDFDFIYNLASVPEPDLEKFLATLRENRLLPRLPGETHVPTFTCPDCKSIVPRKDGFTYCGHLYCHGCYKTNLDVDANCS